MKVFHKKFLLVSLAVLLSTAAVCGGMLLTHPEWEYRFSRLFFRPSGFPFDEVSAPENGKTWTVVELSRQEHVTVAPLLLLVNGAHPLPVMMLTARAEDTDELLGLTAGADDYVTKPFSPMVLAARVRALLKRAGAPAQGAAVFGDLTIDERSRSVTVAGEPVELTPKEYELLVYFKNNRRVALSREAILNAVWGYDYFGDLRTVDTHVKKLRAKLGPCGTMIETVRGFGYRFEGDKT